MSVRTPPLYSYRRGVCQWCDKPIEKRLKKNGEPYKIQSSWHRDCVGFYVSAANSTTCKNDLIKRDGARCVDCCGVPYSWEPRNRPRYFYEYGGGKACEVEWRLMLEVDHNIPLWKVAHLSVPERQWYFTIKNMFLRCAECHKRKSGDEAAERAHFNRLNEEKKPKGRKLTGRGFDKTLRRKMDGTVERRT